MYLLHFALLFSILISAVQVDGFLLTCGAGGIKQCSVSDVPFVVNTTLSVSNCIFDGCPQVRLTTGSLTLLNVTFRNNNQANNGNGNGGAIVMTGASRSASLTIDRCRFLNNTAPNGGAIFITGPLDNQISITNSEFTGNTATSTAAGTGGAVSTGTSVNVYFNQILFQANVGRLGGAIYSEYSSTIRIDNIYCLRNQATKWGACVDLSQGVTVTGTNVTSDTEYSAAYAAFLFADTNNNVQLTNLLVVNALGVNSPVFYCFGPGTLVLRNVLISNAQTTVSTASTIITLQGNTAGTFDNVTIINCSAGYGVIIYGSTLVWNNGLIQGFRGNSVFEIIYSTPVATLRYITVRDSVTVGTGSIVNGQAGIFKMYDCQILNSVGNAEGVFSLRFTQLYLNRTIISGARTLAGDAGVFYLLTGPRVFIGDGVVISNVSCSGMGGIFYHSGTFNVTFGYTDTIITGYSSIGYPSTSFAYLGLDGGGIFDGVSQANLNVDAGSISVIGSTTANWVINGGLKNFFPSNLITWTSTTPALPKIMNIASINNFQMLLSDPFPQIRVIPINFFGSELPYNPNMIGYVIVQLVEISRNATVSGETIKAIVDSTTNTITFKDYDITGKVPGTYVFQVRGALGTLKPVAGTTWPSITVTIAQCDPVSQRLVGNRCLPVVQVGSALRYSFGSISVILCLLNVFSLGLLQKYREYNVVKANSYAFISLMQFGSILSFFSILIQSTQVDGSCMASFWLDNIGFVINLSSLIIKMYRLKKIFQKSAHTTVRMNLSDAYMMRYMIVAIVIMAAYLTYWTAVSPSVLSDQYFSGQNVVAVNRCSSSPLLTVVIAVKFITTLIAAYFAYSIKHVPSNFNESKMIGIACYNWVVFGTIISLIAKLAINDPTSSFVVSSIAIFFPHLSSSYFLAFYRVYLCVVNPETAMSQQQQTDSKPNKNKHSDHASSVRASPVAKVNAISENYSETPASMDINNRND